jgi:phospholipid transport system substrate-binding protein
MIQKDKAGVVVLCLLVFDLLIPFPSRAGAPTEQLRTTINNLLTMVRNPNFKSEVNKDERRTQLAKVVYSRFDFTEMARRSLGPHWRRRTSDEQREFVKIFTGLLEKSYVNRIESYSSEEVVYAREVAEMNYAQVDTKIVSKKGEDFSINYKLHLINADWKVYDIVIENISLVNNYRSQFNRVIVQSSFEDLVRIMKEK